MNAEAGRHNSIHNRPQPQCGLIPCVLLILNQHLLTSLLHWWQLCAPSHSEVRPPSPLCATVTCCQRGLPKTPVRPSHSFLPPPATLKGLHWLPMANQMTCSPGIQGRPTEESKAVFPLFSCPPVNCETTFSTPLSAQAIPSACNALPPPI